MDWPSAWRKFAEDYKLVDSRGPLLIAIDGLDEADGPPNSPLRVPPRSDDLPNGIYLLLTSRPVADSDAPAFLKTHVETLYGAP